MPAAAPPAAIVTPGPAGAPWSVDGLAALRRDLDALLDGSPALRGAHAGILAVDTATGATLYARKPDDEFQPASTLKLLVGSVALERLGPDYRFHTSAYTGKLGNGDGTIRSGVLHGALVVRGGGDPFLGAHDLGEFAAAVAARGIRRIDGMLVIDDSRYHDQLPYPSGWTSDDFAQDYAAQPAALTVEENVMHLTVTPGARAGDAPHVTVAPELSPANGLPFPQAFTCPLASDVLVAAPLATTLPRGAENTLDVERDALGCIDLIGGIPLGSGPSSVDAAVAVPLVYAYRVADARLQEHGVAVPRLGKDVGWAYSPRSASAIALGLPEGAQLVWSHDSAPLGEWLGPRFWIPSDNLVAELLLKEVGLLTHDAPGSTVKGIAYEKKWLESLGIDPGTTTLADGSGLSQYDRITPRDLVAILQHDWNGPFRDLVLRSLPVGGARGTIEGIAPTDAAGRVFAKTGSMMHVRGLAGFLAPRNHGAVTFAFSVDDWNGDYASLAALRAQVLSRIVDDAPVPSGTP